MYANHSTIWLLENSFLILFSTIFYVPVFNHSFGMDMDLGANVAAHLSIFQHARLQLPMLMRRPQPQNLSHLHCDLTAEGETS